MVLSVPQDCVQDLQLRKLVSVSMDGPNVNWKFLEHLQQDHAEEFGSQLIAVGSCGLHTLHNSFKGGFAVWQIDKVLQALHTIFHNTSARREDFTTLTKSSVFPLPFCGHCWIENLPVVSRAIDVWPQIEKYVDAVTNKQFPAPRTASYDYLAVARQDPLIMAKFHIFMAISRIFTPFLTKYQTDEPVLPFISQDLTVLIKSLLKRFIKSEVLRSITPLQLVKLDSTDKTARVPLKNVDRNRPEADVIIQQFEACLSLEAKSESFSSFQPMQTRLDVFLHGHLCKPYPELWTFCKKLLLLSHGQTTVERVFSIPGRRKKKTGEPGTETKEKGCR
ncbi:hypothetical protein AMEX_G26560 [Astyanax mexicanus]|uniref:HAT C-terminal dimerisation domain-containing protein n=1 Tax=Astyanax mexicanus TaxID=7994 RepID=A0A8T2KNQ2_ASTMX|nr:hypothetical protein AMEX_G26560 [Astyanax mexicanus]